MKDVGNDKRFAKELEEALRLEEGLNRERSTSFSHAFAVRSPSSSPDARQQEPGYRIDQQAAPRSSMPIKPHSIDARTLYHLITCLNAAYPDYDFR